MNASKLIRWGAGMIGAILAGACGGGVVDEQESTDELGVVSSAITSTCNAYYTALTQGELDGPYCGLATYNGYLTSRWCRRGDNCSAQSANQCQVKYPCGIGTQYQAGRGGWGRLCGAWTVSYGYWIGPVMTNFYCEPHDLCISTGQCQRQAVACNINYPAYESAGGRVCGYVYVLAGTSGYVKSYNYCDPGDYCTSTTTGTCQHRLECGSGAYYDSYPTGGGVSCGSVSIEGVTYYLACRSGDACTSSTTGTCLIH
jgi:hypothetical protein